MDYKDKYEQALERAKEIYTGSYKPEVALTIAETFIKVFPELKESKDDGIRKELIRAFKSLNTIKVWNGIERTDILSWLEKQGQEDPCKDCEYPMLNCMNFPCLKKQKYQGKSALEAIHEQRTDNANKVEVKPKFKVGDWIIRSAEVFKHNTYLVTKVKDYYVCEELKGRRVTFTFNDVNKNFKLWDISDAKDGDVLVYNNIATEIIMLFRYKAINKPMAYTHFHIFDNDFRVYGCCDCGNGVHPATKEQRDHLFQKIEETGYKWDSDIKKLKRIETINIPFSAKNSELMEATYFIPKGFHAEIVDNKVIIKKSDQPQNLKTN